MKKQSFILLTIMIPALFLLSGCGHPMRNIFTGRLKSQGLMTISIGMSKSHVIALLGEPDILRGSITEKNGQVLELWEYIVERRHFSPELGVYYIGETYWLYFHEDRLVQWGKAGDWQPTANNIQEIRIR